MRPDYLQRRSKLLRRIKRAQLDGMLVTNETNVTYLTGFTGDSSWLWVSPNQTMLLSDTRYTTQIQEECPDLDIAIRDSRSTLIDSFGKLSKSAKLKNVAIESSHVSKSRFDAIGERTAAEIIDTEGWVETLRAIKDKSEIEKIRNSILINERAFAVIRSQLRGEQTEREIAHNLEHQIRAFGGTGCAFSPIVGVGERGALPHGIPSNKRIEESSFVLIDWGAKAGGYCSDLTRVLTTAKIPPKMRKVYEIVLNAQLAAIAKIRPGVSFQSVDAAARSVIENAGFGKKFGHGLGHGFGLQIHEDPFMNPIREGVFKQNMVVTVEPGIYLPGIGGVRIEDDILVTKDGCEVLSTLPKTLDENHVDTF